MSYTPRNPFEHEDWFSELVRIDKDAKTSLKNSYNKFQTKRNPQPMSQFSKVLSFFTTHTLTAVVTATFCLGGVATFAAQGVAPEAYKPTTVVNNLFKGNKSQTTSSSSKNKSSLSSSSSSLSSSLSMTKSSVSTSSQNLNGTPTGGELFKYDLELTTSGVGLEWELTDSKTGDKYLIIGDQLNKKAEELSSNNFNPINQNSGVRGSGGLTYSFSGKVADQDGIINNPNTYVVTAIDKFQIKSNSQQSTNNTPRTDTSRVDTPAQQSNNYRPHTDTPSALLEGKTNVMYIEDVAMNRCVINGDTSNFAMCTNGGIYRFPNGFSDPGDEDVRVFYGNVTQGKSSNDFNVIDGSLSAIRWGGYDNQNLNGVPTSGELFKYDVQLSTSTVGSEWVLTDYSSGDNYIIRGEGLNNRVVELTTTDYKLNNEYDGNRQAKGLAFLFSGKVVDADGIINSPNTYLITNIDKFEVR